MAYMQDTTQSFTITLVGEGIGTMSNLMVSNLTTLNDYIWILTTGTWSPSTPIAYPGDNLRVTSAIQNTGVIDDVIFATFVSAEVTPTEALTQFATVVIGQYLDTEWNFVMPANNVNITINAGHEE